MSVKVMFMKPQTVSVGQELAVSNVRACETIALDGTTTAAAADGEVILLVSTEASTCIVAVGTTPNAAATAATDATSAGFALPAAYPLVYAAKTGDKVQAKAFA